LSQTHNDPSPQQKLNTTTMNVSTWMTILSETPSCVSVRIL